MRSGMKLKYYSKVFRVLVASFASVLLIPLVLIFLLNFYSLNILKNETRASYQLIAERTLIESEVVFKSAIRLNYKIASNDEIKSYSVSEQRDFMKEYEIRCLIQDYEMGFETMSSCYIYIPQHDIVITENKVTDAEAYCRAKYDTSCEKWLKLLDSSTQLSKIDTIRTLKNPDTDTFFIIRNISPAVSGASAAVVVTEIYPEYLTTCLDFRNTLQKGIYVAFVRKDALHYNCNEEQLQLIFEAYEGECSDFFIEDESYILLHTESELYESHILFAVPMDLIAASGKGMLSFFAVAISICLVIIVILTGFLAQKNYLPVQRICSLINVNAKEALDDEYELIESALQNHMRQNQLLQKRCVQNITFIKELYLEKLLLGNVLDQSTIEKGLELSELSFAYRLFATILFRCDDEAYFLKNEVTEEQNYREMLMLMLRDAIAAKVPDHFNIYITPVKKNVVVICNIANGEENEIKKFLEEVVKYTVETLDHDYQLKIFAYISGVYEEVHRLSEAYAEVYAMLTREEKRIERKMAEGVHAGCISQCLAIIEEQYSDNNLSLTMIAETLSVNHSHLSRYFKQQTGIGFLEYLQKYRLNAAKKLIRENSDMVFKEVASKTGFYNESALIRVFKKIENMTPGQYKASVTLQPDTTEQESEPMQNG